MKIVIDQLRNALIAYCEARAMPSAGDYASIDYMPPVKTFEASYGGGVCAKHGQYYGRCHCCASEWAELRKQADRGAVHARDNALRRANDLAIKALEAAA